MRLVCPNCGAQYEVDDRVIPENGRDVQCSNCGHTWFQRPAGGEALADGEPATAPVADGAEENRAKKRAGQEISGGDVEEDTAPETPGPAPQPQEAAGAADAMGDREAGGQAAPVRRSLDESLQEVLREEAEREARVRARVRQKIETQEDLGLEEPVAADQRAGAAQERMARLRGLDTEEDTTASGGAGARRDLLPDIEEINSSLTSIGSEEIVDDFAEPVQRGGFARGFAIMLLLAAILVALYLYAPLIGAKIPALAGPLEAYVGLVDQARGWLDGMVNLALSRLQ